MNWQSIGALIKKDFTLFFRNRFFALVTILGLVAYTALYLVLPKTADETIELAVSGPGLPPSVETISRQGLIFQPFRTEEELKNAVADGEYQAGIVIPENLASGIAGNEVARIDLYLTSTAPAEFREMISILVQELFLIGTDWALNLDIQEHMIGEDMAGRQIPLRDRMIPLFAVMMLLTEMLGLASLVSEEIEQRTIYALLVTPLTISGLFAAKGTTSITLALGQATLLLGFTGGFSNSPLLVLTALLLGAAMVTGFGFLIASAAKDITSVFSWGMPVLIVLIVPAFTVLFPGAASGWIKAVPSYYLVDSVYRIVALGEGIDTVWQNLVVLALFDVIIIVIGMAVLRRRIK